MENKINQRKKLCESLIDFIKNYEERKFSLEVSQGNIKTTYPISKTIGMSHCAVFCFIAESPTSALSCGRFFYIFVDIDEKNKLKSVLNVDYRSGFFDFINVNSFFLDVNLENILSNEEQEKIISELRELYEPLPFKRLQNNSDDAHINRIIRTIKEWTKNDEIKMKKELREFLDKHIDEGAGVNDVDEYGRTALMEACYDGNIEIVEALIEAGADVNVQDKYVGTALMFASCEGYIEIVKLLIDAGVDVDARDESGCTALMWASRWGHVEVVKVLIEAGADLDVKDNCGRTALMMASGNGYTEIVKLLIEAEVDVNAKDGDGWTALRLASREGYTEVQKLLINAGAKE